MNELWRRMAELYGFRWTSQHGECDADGTWARVLSGLTPGQLARGLQTCADVGASRARGGEEDWPPTAGEFLGYCATYKARAHQLYLPTPKPATMTADERAAWISLARKHLSGRA